MKNKHTREGTHETVAEARLTRAARATQSRWMHKNGDVKFCLNKDKHRRRNKNRPSDVYARRIAALFLNGRRTETAKANNPSVGKFSLIFVESCFSLHSASVTRQQRVTRARARANRPGKYIRRVIV